LAFSNQILLLGRAAGPVLISFNELTCVGDQECFIPRATVAIVPGKKAAHKRLNPTAASLPLLSLATAVTAAAAVVSPLLRASFSSPRVLVLSRATTWILVKDEAKEAFRVRAGDQSVEQLRCLPALKIKKKTILFAKAMDHVLVMNLKDWIKCSLQLYFLFIWSENSKHMTIQSYNQKRMVLVNSRLTPFLIKKSWEPDWFICWCHTVEWLKLLKKLGIH
jgi:hypothetical protein